MLFLGSVVAFHILFFVFGFGRLPLCPYEASDKFNCLRTHDASHYLVFYAETALCKYLLLFVDYYMYNQYSNEFIWRLKHLYGYIISQTMFFITGVRILIGSTLYLLRVKFMHSLLFQKYTKRCDIS